LVRQSSAQFLIATVFEHCMTTCTASIQQQSTYLSTSFCGYRKIHYIESPFDDATSADAAVRKLAAARFFAVQSPPQQ
jgi:hypothetical protein